jgi:capsular polysaccharide biosynthesis protein
VDPDASTTTSLRLDQMAGAVRRRWMTVLVVLLVWLGLGAAAADAAPTTYTATAAVTVQPFDNGTSASDSAADMPTEVQAATSSEVLAAVAGRLDESPGTIGDAVTVSNPDKSRVLKISYRASSAGRAAAGANAVAEAYLDVRRTQMQTQAQAVSLSLQKRAESLRTLLAKTHLAETALSSSYAQQLATLESQLSDLDLQRSAAGGEVTTRATPPSGPSGPSWVVYLAGALVIGSACAVAAALLRDRLSRRAGDAALLSDRLGVPVITGAPHASADDVVRTLALRLGLADQPAPLTLAVVGTPHSSLAEELSAHLRRQGARVRCVDARTISGRRVDRGWPQRAYGESSIVVVDISEAVGTPLSATVAGRCDLVILTVTRGSRLGPVDRFVALLSAAGCKADAAVLLHRRHDLCVSSTAAVGTGATPAAEIEESAPAAKDRPARRQRRRTRVHTPAPVNLRGVSQ